MDVPLESGWAATGMVIAALFLLAKLAQVIVDLVYRFRRRPPIDQELINYVRHPELLSAKAELRAEIKRLEENTRTTFTEAFNAIRASNKSMERTFSDVQKCLGRVEGMLDRCPYLCGKDRKQ